MGAALPTLLAFARPGHVLFGSDWPFAPAAAGQYFANGLDDGVASAALAAVNRADAETLFPRLAGSAPSPDRAVRHRAPPVGEGRDVPRAAECLHVAGVAAGCPVGGAAVTPSSG